MKLCAIYILALAAWAADTNWPQFRGPSASGVGTGSPPIEWNVESGKNMLWKSAIPGLGHSSPVIWGDRIFLTSAIPATGEASLKVGLYGDVTPLKGEPAHTFKVYCLDRKSGKILWERTAASGQPKIMRHPKSSHANPTPSTDGKHVVAFFGSEGLFAYDLDGRPLWQKDFGVLDSGFYTAPDAQWGFASSPVLFENMVIIQADVQKNSFLGAFDAATGKELWRVPRADVPTWSTPAVVPYTAQGAKGWQVVVNGWRHIGGYDLKTGKELWRLKGIGGDIPIPTPVFLDDLVVITSAHGAGRPAYAVRTDAAGDITENRAGLAWVQDRVGNYIQTPLLYGGLAYLCYDSGVLSVLRLATGERLYQQRLGGAVSGFFSSPVTAGNALYITNEEGRSFVLAPGDQYKLLAENDLGETVMATPAISAGVLYFRGGKHVFAIGAKP